MAIPEVSSLLTKVGKVLRRRQYDRALDLLQEVFFLDPENPDARICLAFLKGAGTRRARRYRVNLVGALKMAGRPDLSVTLRDVSSTGMRIEAPSPLPNGEPVTIVLSRERYRLPPLSVAGRICWVRREGEAHAAGITLDPTAPETARNLEILAIKTYFFSAEGEN